MEHPETIPEEVEEGDESARLSKSPPKTPAEVPKTPDNPSTAEEEPAAAAEDGDEGGEAEVGAGGDAEATEAPADEPQETEAQPETEEPTPDDTEKVEDGDAAAEPETAEQDETDAEPKETTEGEEGEAADGETAEGEAAEGDAEATAKSPVLTSEDVEPETQDDEALPVVGEVLSREGTPDDLDLSIPPPRLDVDSPETEAAIQHAQERAALEQDDDYSGDEKASDLSDMSDESLPDRDQLLEQYNIALMDREQLESQNYQLQHKLAEYFRKKKADDNRQEMDKNITDQEQRYIKYMSNLEDLRRQESKMKEDYEDEIEELKDLREEKESAVDREWKNFTDYKYNVALRAINSRTGKCIMDKDVEQYQQVETKKESDVKAVRLENIKLQNRLKKREQQLKAKEELAEGLHLIDFEQLKIENQTYNEKIEERNEELLKLRKKITSTVEVLTHLKEKLQFVQAENGIQKQQLYHVEGNVAQKRDILTRTKQARDALRNDNIKLRQKSGLLGNDTLLRDYETRYEECSGLMTKLENLKMCYAELMMNCSGIKKKVDQAKQEMML